MQQIAEGIYAETETGIPEIRIEKYEPARGANPGCVITDRGVVQIDTTKNPISALSWQEEIKKVTNKEIVYVINTDHHLDHTVCNAYFPGTIIGHELLAAEVKKFMMVRPHKIIPFIHSKQMAKIVENPKEYESLLNDIRLSFETMDKEIRELYEKLEIIPPRITFSERMTLNMVSKTLELIHVGGHTVGSILVYVREDKVLFAGDSLFNDLLPNMAHADTARWLEVLAMIQGMDVSTIVPAHGRSCGKEPIKKLTRYIEEMRQRVKKFRDERCSRDEIAAKVGMTDFFPLNEKLGWTPERIKEWSKSNAERVFDEFERKQRTPGRP